MKCPVCGCAAFLTVGPLFRLTSFLWAAWRRRVGYLVLCGGCGREFRTEGGGLLQTVAGRRQAQEAQGQDDQGHERRDPRAVVLRDPDQQGRWKRR